MRLRGIARLAPSTYVTRVIVRDDGGVLGRIVRLDAFDLEQDDGTRVRIELDDDTKLVPVERIKTRWGAVEDDPLFASMRDKAPGPHVEVVLERATIRDGARIVLDGEARDHAFDDTKANPRNAPSRKLTLVHAHALADDDGGKAERLLDDAAGVDPSTKKAEASTEVHLPEGMQGRSPYRLVTGPRVLLALAAAFFLFSLALPTSPLRLDLEAIALALVGLAACFAYGFSLPRFVREKRILEDNSKAMIAIAVSIGAILAMLFFLLMLGDVRYVWSPPSPNERTPNASYAIVGLSALYIVGMAASVLWNTRRVAVVIRALASAPPAKDGAWGGVEGTVRDPTPVNVEGELRALVQVVDRQVQSGSDPDIVVERVIVEGTFFVDTHDGRSYEVTPDDATWASAVRQVTVDTARQEVFLDVVPIGGRIWVVGRPEGSRFTARGKDSLLFYATRGVSDPRGRIRGFAAKRTGVIALVFACSALMIARAVMLSPELPAFHVEGGD